MRIVFDRKLPFDVKDHTELFVLCVGLGMELVAWKTSKVLAQCTESTMLVLMVVQTNVVADYKCPLQKERHSDGLPQPAVAQLLLVEQAAPV